MRSCILALLLWLPGLLLGQAPDPPAPIFPSDGKLAAEANGAELLQAVCPGRVKAGETPACECPIQSGLYLDGFNWSLTRVTRGHFLSPSSDDAVLSMDGCEPHSENFGGTILLTRNGTRWAVKWYRAGVDTSNCHKIQIQGGREILVCFGEFGGQGNVIMNLYVEDLLNPKRSLMADEAHLLSVVYNAGTCGYNDVEDKPFPVTRAFIERVEFPAKGVAPTISVTASYGRRTIDLAVAKTCVNSGKPAEFAPPVKSYHLDFVFDGHTYQQTAASAETARMFESR